MGGRSSQSIASSTSLILLAKKEKPWPIKTIPCRFGVSPQKQKRNSFCESQFGLDLKIQRRFELARRFTTHSQIWLFHNDRRMRFDTTGQPNIGTNNTIMANRRSPS